MRIFNIRFVNRHLLIDYNDKVLMVDTGNPYVITREPGMFEFCGRNYNALYMPAYFNETDEFIGERLDALIGTGVLRDYKVLFDYQNETLTLYDQDEGPTEEWTNSFGIPGAGFISIEAVVGGKDIRFVLDSGACIQYIHPDYIAPDAQIVDHKVDFHPGDGHYNVDIYNVEINIGNENDSYQFGILPSVIQQQIEMYGFKGALGWEFFDQHKIFVDFFKREIKWRRI